MKSAPEEFKRKGACFLNSAFGQKARPKGGRPGFTPCSAEVFRAKPEMAFSPTLATAAVCCPMIRARAFSPRARLDGSSSRASNASWAKMKLTTGKRGKVCVASAEMDEVEDDEESVSMNDLVEMEVGGVSVSGRGFIALLVPKGCKEQLPPPQNQVEILRGAAPKQVLMPTRTRTPIPRTPNL